MPKLTIGDRTLDLTNEVLVVDALDRDVARSLVRAGAVDLGAATPDTLAKLRGGSDRSVPLDALMMSFDSAQLPELVTAVTRGVRIVRAADVDAASKAALVLAAIFGALAAADPRDPRNRR